MTEPSPDALLLARIRQGDAAAVRHFYDLYAERVYRTAYRVLRDRPSAEEVTQDVFVRALASVEQLRDASAAGPWLSSITVRLSYDALRAEGRRSLRFVPLDDVRGAAGQAPVEPLVKEHVRQAIARLSQKLQVVLVMYEIEGHSHAEIAASLHIPLGTSKTRLSQARAALRRELAAYAPSEIDS